MPPLISVLCSCVMHVCRSTIHVRHDHGVIILLFLTLVCFYRYKLYRNSCLLLYTLFAILYTLFAILYTLFAILYTLFATVYPVCYCIPCLLLYTQFNIIIDNKVHGLRLLLVFSVVYAQPI